MNSPSFEFIQNSQIKIHNKPISKTPFFFLTAQTPQITISSKTLHHNNNKVSKIPKAQNPNKQKVPKFESNYYITSFSKPIRTNHHHHPDTQHNNNKQNNKARRSENNRSLENGKKKIRELLIKGIYQKPIQNLSWILKKQTPLLPSPLDLIGFGEREKPKRERERERERWMAEIQLMHNCVWVWRTREA